MQELNDYLDSKQVRKNVTFAIGLIWLLWGAVMLHMPDWTVGLSLVMAGFTYYTAEWVVKTLWNKDYPHYLSALFLLWFGSIGLYSTYWTLVGAPGVMETMASNVNAALYLLCGIIWSLPSPRELLRLVANPVV
jgi:hypothetical protein